MAAFKKTMARLKIRLHSIRFRLRLRLRIAKLKRDLRKWQRIQKGDYAELIRIGAKLATKQLSQADYKRLSQKHRVLLHRVVMWDRDIEKTAKELALVKAQLREFKEL